MITYKTLMGSDENTKQVTHTTNSHTDNDKSSSYNDELPNFATC